MKVKSINDLPDFLKVADYKYLENCSERKLRDHFASRLNVLNMLQERAWELFNGKEKLQVEIDEAECLKVIAFLLKSGAPIAITSSGKIEEKSDEISFIDNMNEFYKIKSIRPHNFFNPLEGVKSLTLKDIKGLSKLYEADPYTDINALIQSDVFESMPFAHCLIDIHLDGYTDDELINSFKHFIPQLRGLLNIPEPSVIKGQTSESRKILNYKVIQYLDLKIWCELSKSKVSNKVIAEHLYPERNDGEVFVKGTVKDFIKKMSDGRYRPKK